MEHLGLVPPFIETTKSFCLSHLKTHIKTLLRTIFEPRLESFTQGGAPVRDRSVGGYISPISLRSIVGDISNWLVGL